MGWPSWPHFGWATLCFPFLICKLGAGIIMAPTLIGLLWGSDGPFYLKCSDVGLARSKHNRRVIYWGRRQFANKTVKEKMKDTRERGLDPGQPVTGSHASAEALWKMLLLTLLAENLTLKPAIRIPFCCQSQTTSGYKSKETSTLKVFSLLNAGILCRRLRMETPPGPGPQRPRPRGQSRQRKCRRYNRHPGD